MGRRCSEGGTVDFDRGLGCRIQIYPSAEDEGHDMNDSTGSIRDGGRTVLITGTSSGIGLATALAAAKAGWQTVATMRNVAASDRLRAAAIEAGVDLEIRTLDVTDPGAVEREISWTIERFGSLDAVINNAGSATVGTLETLEIADFRAAMETNFFGVVLVSRAAMPHLRRSRGRLITVSSVGGVVGQPFNEAYCAAKFAVEGFMESLQPVARSVGVSVSIVEPGAVSSEFVRNAAIDSGKLLAAAGEYAPALTTYLERTTQQFSGSSAQAAEEVADIIVAALSSEAPAFRIQTSQSATAFVNLKLSDLDGSAVTDMTGEWITP
jgi:NAD(P)-dependent dehydrogenase (short-subunit alcohol dehydrogenase family)